MPRKVLSIPTLHAEEENPLARFVKNTGDDEMAAIVEPFNEVSREQWNVIKEEVLKLDIDFRKVKIFSEGIYKDPIIELAIDDVKKHGQALSGMDAGSIYNEVEAYTRSRIGVSPQAELFFYFMARGAQPVFVEDMKRHRETVGLINSLVDTISNDDPDTAWTREDLLQIRKIGY